MLESLLYFQARGRLVDINDWLVDTCHTISVSFTTKGFKGIGVLSMMERTKEGFIHRTRKWL
jgi:hypothetical protein